MYKNKKFKAKGMDVGVSDEYLNGVPVEASSSEPEDEEDEDSVLRKSYKQSNKEAPVPFCNMSEIVGKFETGQHVNSDRHRERKQEIQNIRSRLFMGKQAKIKEMYEQSVLQSEQSITSADKISQELELDTEKSRAIKERFETGEVFNDENQPPRNREIDDRALFNEAEKAHSIKQRFETGDIYRDEKPVKHTEDYERILHDEAEKSRKIKELFETGEAFKDEKHEKKSEGAYIDNAEKAHSIKKRFETGDIYRDEKPVKNTEDYERVLHEEAEKARLIKQRFETGEAFRDEKNRKKSTDNYIDDGERSHAIKQRFETGEAFRDDKHVRKVDNRNYVDDGERAQEIKQRFETGLVYNEKQTVNKNREIDDETLFDQGIGKKSRSIFLELDANAKNMAPLSPPPQEPPKRKELPFIPKDLVRSQDRPEEVKIETADITDRFKFFETYKPETNRKEFRMTPPRQTQRPKSPSPEIYVDPSVARGTEPVDISTAAERHTASRMINVFKQMEEQVNKHSDNGPKPLKRFTPPPPGESNHRGDSSEEYSSEEEDSEEERRRMQYEARMKDEALKQAQQLGRTTSFRGRFENWTESEPQRSPSNAVIEIERQPVDEEDGESQLETAKSLRAKFENMQVKSSVTKTSVSRVNRFV